MGAAAAHLALQARGPNRSSGPDAPLLPPEQPFQIRFGLVHLSGVGCSVGTRPRLEVIAEVGLRLVADFFCRRLAAMLRNARIVVNAHPADVQLGTALRALIESPQRQTQMCQRSTAFPADEIVAHGAKFTPCASFRPAAASARRSAPLDSSPTRWLRWRWSLQPPSGARPWSRLPRLSP
jgi:hypothetical protein